MADDATFQGTTPSYPPTDLVVAADVIGGISYQRVKLTTGADGTATDVSTASPVPVSDAGGSLTVDGTVAVSGAVAVTDNSGSLTVDDGGGSLTVDGTVAVSGSVAVTDNGGTLSVDDGAGSLTVDGTVAATQSGTWNVTNVSGTVSLPTGAATAAKQPALGTAGTASADVVTVQGIASMTALKVDGSAVTQPVSAASLPLPSGASTLAEQQTQTTAVGSTSETAPATDTATSGLNGRLQRIAQRLTSLIALLPTSLGQKSKAASLAVTLASDQDALPVTQSGTWTVQPGNTANTTAWKVDGSAVTQPVSLATVAVTNAGTFAIQDSEKVADNAGFTDGTTKVVPVGLIFDEVAGTALTENDIGAARMDAKRASIGVLEDATTRGQRAAVSSAGRLSVDASGVAVPVTDNSGSLTVDAPVGTPVFVRLSDGSAAIATLPVSIATAPVLVAGSAIIGKVGIDQTTPGTTNAVSAVLTTGSAAIGKLTANSGVNIGDVGVASVAGTGTNAAAQVTVTNSSTSVIAARSGRRGVLLTNNQNVAVYLDPSGGTATTSHYRLDPGASVFLPVASAVTGITSAAYSASGDAKVHYAEFY